MSTPSPAESLRGSSRRTKTPDCKYRVFAFCSLTEDENVFAVAEPLYQVKLLTALRNGDVPVVQNFLSNLSTSRSSRHGGDSPITESQVDIASASLHLAIRCAPASIVRIMLSHRAISPNAFYPTDTRTTPLHLAASLGRAEIVELLLEQPEIDDTVRDDKGRTCKEVARGNDVLQVIQDSQTLLQASYRSLLRTYILSPPTAAPPESLLKLLQSSRAKLLDLSCLDDATGTTLLHEAARRKDLRLVELSVRAGADVFVRDRKGKTVGEGAGKDDRVKVFLRQFTNQDTSLLDGPSTSPPVLKGFLNKYTNYAKGYNSRWFVLKDGVLSYYRHRDEEDKATRGSVAMSSATVKSNSGGDKLRFEVHSNPINGKSSAQKWYIKTAHPAEASRWLHALQRSIEWTQQQAKQKEAAEMSSLRNSSRHTQSKRRSTDEASVSSSHVGQIGMTDADEKVGGSSGSSFYDSEKENAPPHSDSYSIHANTLVAQLELTSQLLDSLSLPPMPSPKVIETRKAIKDSLTLLQNMFQTYSTMSREREDWWKEKLTKERDRAAVWEESLNVVVREGEVLERELRNTLRAPKAKKRASVWVEGGIQDLAASARQSADVEKPLPPRIDLAAAAPLIDPKSKASAVEIPKPPIEAPVATQEATDGGDTEDEDEFFDAIESGTLPVLVTAPTLVSTPAPKTSQTDVGFVDVSQYASYQHLREKIPIGVDERPAISLWSVLRNNIGKDLTKISFPVTFNEPTSMLQRMAEDMEFSECLDAASSDEDPHRRIAFVAAFAMSNYSSTIGRIAKPFNPMLGETFEYVSLNKRYRYVSEQVSHHPPISACWAESPSWHYFGEVDAQNKFMGKSFEIRPTGVAHAELLIPEAWASDYPKASGSKNKGKVVEHYSWKKVTTNVSGFILGSPTIDHYGDMNVVNHRTGDQCILTFKPRGWRGKDAFEISGKVMDADGRVTYEIAGRWNSQLVARQVGTGIGDLLPDVEINSPPVSPTIKPRYILLWRNTDKPLSPFNLTPYAITLNDCPDGLKPQLPSTDCRLRPDQRAFETGQYERANILKINQEEFQRATRRKREEGALPPHRPRWFKAITEPETRERVWSPLRELGGETIDYWTTREKVATSGGKEQWTNVDKIFISDDDDT